MGTELLYCRRCGAIYPNPQFPPYEEWCHNKICKLPKLKFFSSKEENKAWEKELENQRLVKLEGHTLESLRKPGEPYDYKKLTPSVYEYVWNNYVNVPENDALVPEYFEATKKEVMSFLKSGGWNGVIVDLRDKKEPKDASVIGRGVAGAIIAGPAGAVIGAASALDKNIKNANKKK